MKKLILGAGALFLGSTAMAGTGLAATTPWAMSPALQSAVVDAGMSEKSMLMPGMKNASLTEMQMGEKQSWLSQTAGTTTSGKNAMLTADQMGEKQMWLAENGAGKLGEYSGQGGPDEMAETTGAAMWPACRPGAGDDRCIQLYERGVSRAFALWSAGRSATGMGGPDESMSGKDGITSTTSDMSMSAKADTATGPTTEPTGVRAEGKSAMSMGTTPAMTLMADADFSLEDDGMALEQVLGAA